MAGTGYSSFFKCYQYRLSQESTDVIVKESRTKIQHVHLNDSIGRQLALCYLNGTECGYTHRNLMYEILNEPDRSMEQLSEDLNARPEVVKDLINDIETALNQDKGGKENDE